MTRFKFQDPRSFAELVAAAITRSTSSSGRIGVTFVMESLSDGMAEKVSDGFFDLDDVPAQNAWIVRGDDLTTKDINKKVFVLWWAPDDCVARAQIAIDACATTCIAWADATDLREVLVR